MRQQQQHDLKHHYRGIEVGSTRQCGRSYVVNAAPGESFESQPPKNIWDSLKNSIDAFYRFSRPHTIIGTVKKKITLKKFRLLLCILPHRLKVTADKKVQTLVSDEKSEEVYRIKIVNLCFNT